MGVAPANGEPLVARSGVQVATNDRPDLERLVPAGARRVLDVGCAYGALGHALKRRGVETVVGIELNPEAARRAAELIDTVIVCDVELKSPQFDEGWFDCIVYGDILEHLVDPWAVLRKHRRFLAPGGVALISIPNIGYWPVLRMLLRGQWRYTSSGTLDRTHLRFFTLSGIEELCRQAGLGIERVHTGLPRRSLSGRLNRITGGRFEHLLVWRYVVEARPEPSSAASG